jgi:hypothetical protein
MRKELSPNPTPKPRRIVQAGNLIRDSFLLLDDTIWHLVNKPVEKFAMGAKLSKAEANFYVIAVPGVITASMYGGVTSFSAGAFTGACTLVMAAWAYEANYEKTYQVIGSSENTTVNKPPLVTVFYRSFILALDLFFLSLSKDYENILHYTNLTLVPIGFYLIWGSTNTGHKFKEWIKSKSEATAAKYGEIKKRIKEWKRKPSLNPAPSHLVSSAP